MKCIRCGKDQYQKICHSCMSSWTGMRVAAYDFLTKTLGAHSKENDKEFKKEIKRLEALWRKNKDQFNQEITTP